MSQMISINATTGEFILPCFEHNADAFETGLAFNTTGLEIQIGTNDGTWYRYVVGGDILNNTAPADATEISFAQFDATNGWFVKLRVHLSVFSGLDVAAGESIGMLGLSATGFAPVTATLMFAKSILTDVDGRVEADLTRIGGAAQSATDFKHFVDSGYDPGTGQVEGVKLVDTLTTYTSNTVQTGDSFARLGAPAGASVSADIADVPTVAEFNARTLAAVDYFDPATDTVANVTSLTNLPTMPTGWITALGIAADAITAAKIADGAIDAATFAAGAIDAAAIATNAIGADEISAAAANKLADHIKRRTQANTDASSDGDALSLLSFYGLVQQAQESNATATPGTLTVYRTDGTTVLGTRVLAADAAADPVVGIT